ncbi:hypothetical protein L3Y34_003223 [Caenorhabditis briggsae]|uniref:Uncharacterized protein n=1 Tax=Caenorhabditis briggsae TaxID=6238 RepID=A0AAE9A8V1_CAEBR|nr:hypothetical protein L3Y34_003223 [Caenorhabditis briggsae]
MLLIIFILLWIPSSLALVDSIHNTKDSGDLFPMVFQNQFDKNFVHFAVYNNFKTGENISEPSYTNKFDVWRIPMLHHGLYWELTHRDEDNYPDEEAFACAYRDVDSYRAYQKPELVSDQSRLEVGESKMSGNGMVRVKCSRFDGHVRRVSEAFSGCYYNGTVHRINTEWEEPNPGNDSSLRKLMSCQKSENGYFENKLVGCLHHDIRNSTDIDDSLVTWANALPYRLNEVQDYYLDNQYKKCVESEPGVVKLEKVAEDAERVCTIDNVVYHGSQVDYVKGAWWSCDQGNQNVKRMCIIGKNRFVNVHMPEEHQLPNGCKFICHPQTNIFKCDESLSMFKVEGKPRKMRKYKGARFGLPFYR